VDGLSGYSSQYASLKQFIYRLEHAGREAEGGMDAGTWRTCENPAAMLAAISGNSMISVSPHPCVTDYRLAMFCIRCAEAHQRLHYGERPLGWERWYEDGYPCLRPIDAALWWCNWNDPMANPEASLTRCNILRDVFGYPFEVNYDFTDLGNYSVMADRNFFRYLNLDPLSWRDGLIIETARDITKRRAYDELPILADMLEEAEFPEAPILAHLRGISAPSHGLGCWALQLFAGLSGPCKTGYPELSVETLS
jgi:hypothetical protein